MKKILVAVGVLLLVVLGAMIFAWLSMDGIIKTSIETNVSRATKTQVNVGTVKINLKDGVGSISGLNVGNVDGFTDPYIFKLGPILMTINASAAVENPVVIDELVIVAPRAYYEIDELGLTNFDALKQDLLSLSYESATGGGEEIRMVIRRFVMEDGEIYMRIAALGGKQEKILLSHIELNNIGKKGSGATPQEVAQLLFSAMLQHGQRRMVEQEVQPFLGKSLDELKEWLLWREEHIGLGGKVDEGGLEN